MYRYQLWVQTNILDLIFLGIVPALIVFSYATADPVTKELTNVFAVYVLVFTATFGIVIGSIAYAIFKLCQGIKWAVSALRGMA